MRSLNKKWKKFHSKTIYYHHHFWKDSTKNKTISHQLFGWLVGCCVMVCEIWNVRIKMIKWISSLLNQNWIEWKSLHLNTHTHILDSGTEFRVIMMMMMMITIMNQTIIIITERKGINELPARQNHKKRVDNFLCGWIGC